MSSPVILFIKPDISDIWAIEVFLMLFLLRQTPLPARFFTFFIGDKNQEKSEYDDQSSKCQKITSWVGIAGDNFFSHGYES